MRPFLLFALLLLLPLTLSAQPQLEWSAIHDSLAPVAICADPVGNVVISGQTTLPPIDGAFRTAKYNADGDVDWEKVYNGPAPPSGDYDWLAALAVDPDGDVIIVGTCAGEFTNRDYITIKYGSNGSLAWERRYYYASWNGNWDDPSDVVVDDVGNIFVTGTSFGEEYYTGYDLCTIGYTTWGDTIWIARTDFWTDSTLSGEGGVSIALNPFGDPIVAGWVVKTGAIYNYYDVLLQFYGGNGWTATYGDNLHREWGVDVTSDPDGNFIVAAKSAYWTDSEYRNPDYLVIKYSPTGSRLWERYYNGDADSTDMPVEVATDNDGNIYVTGYSYNDTSYFDWCTIKYSPAGNEEWIRYYDRPYEVTHHYSEKAIGLDIDEEGYIYVCGSSFWWETWGDATVVKYDSDGNELWAEHFNYEGGSSEAPIDFDVDQDGNIYILSEDSDHRSVLCRYSQSTGVNDPTASVPQAFHIGQNYPNPFNPSTVLSFELRVASFVKLAVYDTQGRKVADLVDGWRGAGAHEVTFDGSGLASGLYFYRLTAGEFSGGGKMVLLK